MLFGHVSVLPNHCWLGNRGQMLLKQEVDIFVGTASPRLSGSYFPGTGFRPATWEVTLAVTLNR